VIRGWWRTLFRRPLGRRKTLTESDPSDDALDDDVLDAWLDDDGMDASGL
jgi:hypothetical protein